MCSPAQFTLGDLPREWHQAPASSSIPPFQTHWYDDDFALIRQTGSTHYEKPFLYLLFGSERAILFDTGAGNVEVAPVIDDAVQHWRTRNNRRSVDLIVAHTHAHSDHIAGDHEFAGRSDVTFVAPTLSDVTRFFRIARWPDQIVPFDLGDRVLDLIPIPGHEATSIAVYDRRTAILLTGDTLYPGRLYVEDGDAFIRSIERLVAFTADKPVAHILGCHIENTRTPFIDYPIGTTDQPHEHELALGRAHLLELHDALQQMNGTVTRRVLRDFTIWPKWLEQPARDSSSS